ncbi:alpha/beta fold hydrolase, partial [Streptomyces sp. AV19]|uniref:alpha/beta fold hydrolase n=1 Tax=Streptomyces sp. AV19 TaxID=2793068 RepID=UPI0018FEB7BB
MSEQQTLQYRTDGPEDAPVLVLGPALGTTWHMWDRQIPELIRTWRVLRFDLPGHGGAPARSAVTVGDLTDRLLATLDALGVDDFGYAGSCLGGALGADLALRHPQRLAALALVGASARFGTAESWGVRASEARSHGLGPAARTAPEHWFTPGFAAAQPAIVDWAVQMVRTTDVPCYSAACEALAVFDARPGLGRVDVPTLVLVGAEDEVTPPADARVLVAGIHDARLAVVPGTRHLAPVEQPAAVTDLLVRHFTTAWRQPSAHRAPAPGPLPQTASPWPQGGTPAEGTVPAGAVPAPQGVFGPPPGGPQGPGGAFAGFPGRGPGDTPPAGVPYVGGAFGAGPAADAPGAGAGHV